MSIEKSADKINGDFRRKSILSLGQFTPQDIDILFQETPRMQTTVEGQQQLIDLKGQVVSLLFYEPSSRSYGSFASAVQRLGGGIIPVQNPEIVASVAKGETLEDTVRTYECWSDGIIIRTRNPGDAAGAAKTAQFVPVINAGDGIGEHPTQALYDLYTIREKFGRLNDLTGVITGDLLNGRTVHSLLKGLALYQNNAVFLLSPESLRLPPKDITELTNEGLRLVEIDSVDDIPRDTNFWYWTRVQKERFASLHNYEAVKHQFILTPELLRTRGNDNMLLMHPLPRTGEIEAAIDLDPRSVYLRRQMRNGLFVRMALLALVMGK
ncbi:aspartate carbamoyltransferase [Candidatus Daviesbacteria bacterium]|nr:aspartate carbamoyltransferase [Candidatus Daviesbacteria bacterium]